jgi:hypothetical protein
VSAAVTGLRGVASGLVTVSGSLPRPVIAGSLAVDNAAARLAPLGVQLRDVAARVRVERDTVVIDSVVGRSGPGTVRVAGRVGIAEPARPSFNVQLRTDGARVLNNDQGRIIADAQIAAFGPYDAVRVSGGVLVRTGVIYLPESDGKNVEVLSATNPMLLAVADSSTLRAEDIVAAPDPLLDNLQLNLNVNISRDVWVRSAQANVEVYTDGDLTVGIDRRLPNEPITVAGVVGSERGQYEFQGRRFEITRGQATFFGGPQIDATLQATAEYEVERAGEALRIRLLIGGTVSDPRLSLESNSQPPISQSDLIAYLAFGRSSSSLLQQQGSSLAGGSGGGRAHRRHRGDRAEPVHRHRARRAGGPVRAERRAVAPRRRAQRHGGRRAHLGQRLGRRDLPPGHRDRVRPLPEQPQLPRRGGPAVAGGARQRRHRAALPVPRGERLPGRDHLPAALPAHGAHARAADAHGGAGVRAVPDPRVAVLGAGVWRLAARV